MKRNIARIVFLVIAIACFGYVGWYYYDLKRTESDVSALSARVGSTATATVPGTDQTAPAPQDAGEEVDEEGQRVLYVLPDFEPLLDKNQNIIGWIAIEGTKVNYPVMQSINGDSTYYLNHNFDQQEDKNGSLFLDDRCDVIKPTVNLIIYGHHMRSGAMFGDLDNYKSESFFKSHPYIIFNSLYETGTWAVMAAFESKAYTDADIGFRYYDFIDPQTEKEFRNGVNNMKSLSLYDTGVDASFGDRLITLSTCDYEEENGRFVVVAKKIQ
ncbi:MAG TPA: SrtB family sortase [Lachnospiraceae bacterium]|nr:SrtB family sortase [Lachnospiraceae bacterium]